MLAGKRGQNSHAFTIVELLIVIVVIGILAAITIVAYNGIQNRARDASMVSDLTNTAKQLELVRADTGAYPLSTATLNDGQGIKASQSTTVFQYLPDNSTNPPSYCLVAINGNSTYSVSPTQAPSTSACSANIVSNSSFETDTAGWYLGGTTAMARSNTRAYVGNYSLLITSAGSGSDRFVYANVPTARAGAWKVTANVYLEAGNATDFSRGMWLNNLPATTSTQVSYNLTTLNTWQPVTLNYTTPSGSTGVWIRFYVMPGSNVYIDNIQMTPL